MNTNFIRTVSEIFIKESANPSTREYQCAVKLLKKETMIMQKLCRNNIIINPIVKDADCVVVSVDSSKCDQTRIDIAIAVDYILNIRSISKSKKLVPVLYIVVKDLDFPSYNIEEVKKMTKFPAVCLKNMTFQAIDKNSEIEEIIEDFIQQCMKFYKKS